jgi:diacylglycerol O-acyltransferase
VPTGESSIVERFDEVRRRLTTTKGEQAIGLVSGLAGLINVLPTSVVVRFARQQVETIDFTTSNVRAAPFDLYIAGAKLEGNYPLGPLAGTAFNLTMMSYRGWLNMGLYVDRGAIDEPERLRRSLEEAYAELIAAGA